ncbi:MAG: hypothetical protein N3E50_01545 [Candidatus Goldbacteria bacterium]|nr:hypothetical protein [Candidatus Goldiibacteriota bacterium]
MDEKMRKIIRHLIWDYNISEDEFLEILYGKKQIGWFDNVWALKRAIEGLNYYDLINLVGFEILSHNWKNIRDKIRSENIKKGIDYVLRRFNISTSG